MNLFTQTASYAVAVTPSDTENMPRDAAALYIGASGDLSVLMPSGITIIFANVPAGFFPVNVRRVNETGTTATSIVALR